MKNLLETDKVLKSIMENPAVVGFDPVFEDLSYQYYTVSECTGLWRFLIRSHRLSSHSSSCTGRLFKKQFHNIRNKILSSLLDCTDSEIEIHYETRGRPILIHPVSDLFFSTSYANSCMTIAVSLAGPVGVDIEDIRNGPDIMRIAKRFFKEQEWNYLLLLPKNKQLSVFYQLWTLKEAYLKDKGTGFAGWDQLPDFSECIHAYGTPESFPFPLMGNLFADIQISDTICQSIVFHKEII